MYVLEGQIRFRVGDDEFVAGPGTRAGSRGGVPHTFRVESEGGRALVIFTPESHAGIALAPGLDDEEHRYMNRLSPTYA
jgi:quercetin dioxygenase-like cupin family protein